MKKVECNKCHKKYENMFESYDLDEDTNQGYKCAASVYINKKTGKMEMHGHYGSTLIDCQIWEFNEIDESIDTTKEYNICDKCISKLIKENKIKLIRDGAL